jgi:hypothetical protein
MVWYIVFVIIEEIGRKLERDIIFKVLAQIRSSHDGVRLN